MNGINKLVPEKIAHLFLSADPFPHLVIDNFLDADLANNLKTNFPTPDQKEWWLYDNPLEKKLAFNRIEELPSCFIDFFSAVNSEEFLQFLSRLTGINEIKADPQLHGGGLHLIRRGGKLDIHEDFNIHKGLMMLRKLNLILYLNDPWPEEWGGHLELWDSNMSQCRQKILPKFNRAVIFRTDTDSNHGHPYPLECPEERYRISLATYYYIEHPDITNIPYRSTAYKALPGVEDGLDSLREIRKNGRLENLKY